MIKIAKILHWGGSCPFQLDALTDDNRLIYGRYRFGHLTVSIGDKDDLSEDAAVFKESIFAAQVGGGYDGCMELQEFQNHTKEVIDWSEAFDQHSVELAAFLAKYKQ